MNNLPGAEKQVRFVTSFHELVNTPYDGAVNAICWSREPAGDFSEIVNKLKPAGNITVLDEADLLALELSEAGRQARQTLLNDLEVLREHGAAPVLNLIRCYDRDDTHPFFPTDVYSFHADRSPVPAHTFLCTYYGAASEIVPNAQAQQKILIPEVRNELEKLYNGPAEAFDTFLKENFFDLHYQAKPGANIIGLGLGQIWKLAVDYPQSNTLPCVHRAPEEKNGQPRLLLIC